MENKEAREMAKIAFEALDEKFGNDINIIKIDGLSVICDYLVITDGSSNPQIHALVENVEEKMEENGYFSKHIEGNRNATWVLMDYGDVIIHVFSREDREFYNLERIWKDGETVFPSDL